jgi:uncharacterized protein YutE (UPF0331/DUF86 family)
MDTELLLHKLSYQKELLEKVDKRLKKYVIEKDIETKETLFAAMSKFCEEIVEVGIKVNNLILHENNDYADTFYETFSKLPKYLKFDTSFIEKIAKTTELRNRIAHEYGQLDEKITIRSFENVVKLYTIYIKEIKKLI